MAMTVAMVMMMGVVMPEAVQVVKARGAVEKFRLV